MKRFFSRTILLLVLVIAHTTANSQQANIYPKPQEIAWGNEIAFTNSVAFTLNGAEDADADAIALFQNRFSTNKGTVQAVIGERGDAAVAEYESFIPQKAEGYYLEVSEGKVVIAGNDNSGTYYGVQTFIQMASQPNVMCATITDYPSVPQRGLVEGYYGNPYSDADRNSLFKMFGELKMNVYIYGPKDDVYHKNKWREPYPEADGKRIAELAAAAAHHKVRFVWALHPGVDIKWTDADRKASLEKLEKMYELGIRDFAIFFDDIFGEEQKKGDGQAEYLNYINANFVKKHTDISPLIMCPTEYNKAYIGYNSNYLSQLGGTTDKETNIMWTGNGVVDMINKSDMSFINGKIQRNAYIWLNYPVTDYCINHLLMGPTYGNDLNISDMLSGFVSNPMEYAEASKVSLFSIGDYTWNMPDYDSDTSWEAALEYLMPENTEAFRFFCENNVDLGPNVHGLRRMNESPEFVEAKAIFDSKIASDRQSAYKAVGEQFNKFVTTTETLLATDEAPALISEIEPWILAMKYMGQKGVSIIEMNNAIECENPDSFINSYIRYKEFDEAQAALRSRNFAGSLKSATPVVATLHVEPFIKEALGTLIAEYREKYDYRNDIFPAQVLENGTYHIKHNGRYLTNNQPNVASSAPQFQAETDDTRPQKQEWKITVDPTTDRYKIINLEDNRYLNEKGVFTVSYETNPYDAAWHTYEITQLANGKYAIRNAGSAGNNFWSVTGTRITQSTSEALPDKYVFDLTPLGDTPESVLIEENVIYYIMDGDRFLTNTNIKGSGGTPIFKNVTEPATAQEWKISVDSNGKNCYKITSNADGRYINEYGVFGTNQYYSDWNTYLLTRMGDLWSIQCTQSAIKNGVKFLVVSGDRLEQKNTANSESYSVKIISKEDYTSVKDIDAAELKHHNGSIIAGDDTENIVIYSPDGRVIREKSGRQISTSDLAKGLYIAVARNKGKTVSLKFVVE